MKVSLLQLNVQTDKSKNVAKALEFVKKAASRGAKFILLPEVFVYRGFFELRKILKEIAEPIPGPTVNQFKKLAKECHAYILAGSIYEKVKGSKKVYNSSVLISDKGKIIAKYRKMNLFDALIGQKKLRESKHFLSGNKVVASRVKEFRVGLSICYDLRFPSLYQDLSAKGVNVMCIPSNFTKETGLAHWEILLRSRAIENLSYVLAPDQVGTDVRGIPSFGNSLIIDPWGKVLARGAPNKEQIISADIKLSRLKEVRQVLPAVRKD